MPQVNFHEFKSTSEWQLIVNHLRQMEMDLVNEVVTAGESGDAFKLANISGQIRSIREFIALPDYLYSASRGGDNAQESNKEASRPAFIKGFPPKLKAEGEI